MNDLILIYVAVFLLTAAALILICGLDKGIGFELRRWKKAGAMKLRKRTLLTKLVHLNQKRLQMTVDLKITETVYWLLTAIGAVTGAAAGKLIFCNTFFTVLVSILGVFCPWYYLDFKQQHLKSQRIEKLHSTMLILSNSYLVTEDFLKSVQDNIDVLEYPAPFRDFLTYVSLIDSNVKTGLRRMENQVDNVYFSQWIDVLVMAQEDRSLKYVTISVVDAMNDVRQAQRESDTTMYAIWREYFTVLILIFSAPMIFRILMKQAFTVLISTFLGQVLLVLLLAAVVFSVIRAAKLNKPLLM
jgi:hypothetical protein